GASLRAGARAAHRCAVWHGKQRRRRLRGCAPSARARRRDPRRAHRGARARARRGARPSRSPGARGGGCRRDRLGGGGGAAARFPVELATGIDTANLLPLRDPRAHKGASGRGLIVGGAPGLTGAVTLAARGATRAGAGYVQCAVPEGLCDILAVKLTTEMTLAAPQSAGRTLARAALERIQAWAERADAVLIGSGLSRDPERAGLARALVAARALPTVLDADGLNAYEGTEGFDSRSGAPLVVTPHLGEMGRLTGDTPASLEARRIEAAREWAARWKAVVVLKGAPTVTAAPDGRATVNPTGNPGLATAGTGDVLAGMIVALLAQRPD